MPEADATTPYSPATLELVQVSVEVCRTLEHARDFSREDFMQRLRVLLPMVYMKASLLGEVEAPAGWREQKVTEDDYDYVRHGVCAVMGDRDDYLDVFVEDFRYSDAPVLQTVSENLADVYQALRELTEAFREGHEEEMSLALYETLEEFRRSWGQTLLNALRALHDATYGGALK